MEENKTNSLQDEETLKLRAERRALSIKTNLEIIKAITLFLGSIIVFIIVTRPESILNRRATQELVSRERAKLILELIQEKDPRKISLGLSVIEASYPNSEEEWFIKLKKAIEKENNAIEQLIEKYNDLLENRKRLELEIEYEMTEGTKNPGLGARYALLNEKLKRLNQQIKNIEEVLINYGVKEVSGSSVLF